MNTHINPFDLLSGKVVDNCNGTFWFKSAGNNLTDAGFPLQENLHREGNLPACVWKFTKGLLQGTHYFLNGQRHREDGPAMCGFINLYYLHGIRYSKEDYDKKIARNKPI